MPLTLTLPTVGGDDSTWGGEVNTALTATQTFVNGLETSVAALGTHALYAIDSGSAGHLIGVYSPVIAAHTGGLALEVRAGFANVGAVDFDPGPGAKSVVDADGNALTTGAILVGTIYTLIYNAGADNYQLQGRKAATAAQVLAGAETSSFIAPATLKHHYNVVHAAAQVTIAGGVPSIVGSFNVASVAKTSTGRFTVTFGADDMGWGIAVCTVTENAAPNYLPTTNGTATPGSTMTLYFRGLGGSLTDPDGFNIIVV